MPTFDASGAPDTAIAALEAAFSQGDRYCFDDRPRVGVFGSGMPETLVKAAGACPVHVEFGMAEAEAGTSGIDAVLEPFLDSAVCVFLQRFARGDFADLRGIIFARDDAPALVAYQYATEWVRQGRAPAGSPPLFLWNLVHTDTAATRRFNQVQADKLFGFFEAIGLERPEAEKIATAAAHERARANALLQLNAARERGLGAATAIRWRNAGRFMPAELHAKLLEAVLADPQPASNQSPARLAVIGSPFLSVRSYAALDALGTVACDLQPWGDMWPGSGNGCETLEELLVATSADWSCNRIVPTSAFREGIIDRTAAAGCDVVICQLAQTDDTIGWEVPALAAAFAARGTAFVNLGFRDPEPGEPWLEAAAKAISAALEARR